MDWLAKIINEWDPIGLMGCSPENEYNLEIQEIRSRTLGISEEEMMADIIYEVFKKYFDSSFTKSKMECIDVARIIINKCE